jgi:hypothetical protein
MRHLKTQSRCCLHFCSFSPKLASLSLYFHSIFSPLCPLRFQLTMDSHSQPKYDNVPLEDHDEAGSNTEVDESLMGDEKKWHEHDFQTQRKRSGRSRLMSVLGSGVNTVLLLAILGLLVRQQLWSTSKDLLEIGSDFTGFAPKFSPRITTFQMEYKYQRENTSEFFTDEVMHAWNDLMPSMSYPSRHMIAMTLTQRRRDGLPEYKRHNPLPRLADSDRVARPDRLHDVHDASAALPCTSRILPKLAGSELTSFSVRHRTRVFGAEVKPRAAVRSRVAYDPLLLLPKTDYHVLCGYGARRTRDDLPRPQRRQ